MILCAHHTAVYDHIEQYRSRRHHREHRASLHAIAKQCPGCIAARKAAQP